MSLPAKNLNKKRCLIFKASFFVFVRRVFFLFKTQIRIRKRKKKQKKTKLDEKRHFKNIRQRIFYRLKTSADAKIHKRTSADVV